MTPHIEELVRGGNICGEGPIWDSRIPRQPRLIWNDCGSSLVFELDPPPPPANGAGQHRTISKGLMAAGIALNRDGALVFCGATGLHLWKGQDNFRTLAAKLGDEDLFFNDMIADARGRLYAGTMYWGETAMLKPGKLYLIEGTGHARAVDDGIQLANGLAFSNDDRTLYFADSAARRIYAYDVDGNTGNLSAKRVLVQVPKDEGIPDGLTVDAEGFIWSAQWYGGQVVRYDPQGKVERRIAIPALQVSSLAFGGPDFADLYVTTAAGAWPTNLAPPGYDAKSLAMGGSLYRIRLNIAGRPEHLADLH